MFFTRSALASAAILSFTVTTEGWVLHRSTEEHVEVKRVAAEEGESQWSWKRMFGKRQNDGIVLDCPNDQFAALLSNNPDSAVETFCNDWLNLAPATTTIDVTPTVTVTTSNSQTTTQTSTQRVLATTTAVETATITAAPTVRRRMMAAAQQIEIASKIIDSVMASGAPTTTPAATSLSPNRLAAERGLETACSCRLPAPTSTVTEYFTVPDAVTTTVGVRYLKVVQTTETRTYTSTTTVSAGATVSGSTSATASSSTGIVSSSTEEVPSTLAEPVGNTPAAGGNATASSASEVASTTPAITAVPIITIPVGGNATATTASGAAVVTALPFSCDENDITRSIDQVVGGIRLGYNVYCNSGFTQDRIGRPITTNTSVDDATSCAAQCSLLNTQGQSDACASALFTPSADGSGGSCTLYSATEDGTNVQTTPAPGSVAIVHTGTFANGDECAALNATSVSFDTSAVVASITSGGVVVATPGLVTQSSGGGVSQTYVSANSTDAQGYVHWSWYQIYASSASWYAIYETSWACSATITRTIEQPATTIIGGTTITSVVVTTIIANGYTTIISGDSTTTIGGGGGVGGPTLVPAITTSGEGGITTIFSTAAQGSTGTNGIVTPTATPGGQGNVTVIEVFSTFFSTASEGVIPPSASPSVNVSGSVGEEVVVSSTATTLTISGANATFFSTGGNGVISPVTTPIVETIVSSGATTITISGSNATAVSTGGNGVIPPAVTSSATSSTGGDEDEWDTPGPYGPPRKTSTVVSVSSEVITFTSTGSAGVETPTVITTSSSETLVVVITNSTTSANSSATTFTSVATLNVTGSESVATPTTVTEVTTTAAGTGNLTVIVSTATANSTGGGGVIPPPVTVTETVNSTLPVPTPAEVSSTGGVGNFSTGFETGVTISTGASGVIPPASTNTTTPFVGSTSEAPRVGSFTRSSSLSIANSTGSSGFATPTSNSSTIVETPVTVTETVNSTLSIPTPTGVFSTGGIGNFSTGSGTAVTFSTGGSGVIPPASTNATTTPFVGSTSEAPRVGTYTRSVPTSNSTASSGFPTPSLNSSTIIPPPVTVTETVNSTLSISTPTAVFSTGGVGNFSTGFGTGVTISTGGSGVIPPASTNATTTPFVGSTSEAPRVGTYTRPVTRSNSTGTSGFPTPSANSSTAIETPSLNTTLTLTVPLSTGFTSTFEIQVNSSVPFTSAPSATPSPSFNGSSSTFTGTTSEENRSGTFSRPLSSSTTANTTSAPPATLVVTATTNITLSFPTGNITLIPPTTRPFENSTTTFPTITSETLVSINYSTVPSFSTGNLSTILPPVSTNVSITVETTPSASATLPPVSLNSTTSGFNGTTFTDNRTGRFTPSTRIPLTTGTSNGTTSSPPFPTGNSTVPLIPTAPATTACPSVSEFSFVTREVIITTTIVETIPISPLCLSANATGTLSVPGNTTLPTEVTVLPSITASALLSSSSSEDVTEIDTEVYSYGRPTAIASAIASVVSSVVADITVSATSSSGATATPVSLFRRSGTLATQPQIDAVCAASGNVIQSPTLAIQPDDSTPGWFVSSGVNPAIIVESVSTDNGTIVRFSSAFAGEVAQLDQPLVLCPGTVYTISGLTRQDNTRSGCTVQYRVGSNTIFTATPSTTWSANSATFTAGPGTEGASQDLTLVLSCAGRGGAPLGVNAEGYMVGEVSNVTVTPSS
ncbi:hypothetical protein E8E13_007600 [Curvularia kusanoi]|uniref:Uncharacterized protein n=1 Tax=Curvularia kusanoi TaxID=90978 RepID=A0A9P4W9V5_CURKU|nr:hypothetical protein E8E13_007600 [Curvularia kusanoi]